MLLKIIHFINDEKMVRLRNKDCLTLLYFNIMRNGIQFQIKNTSRHRF